MLWLAVICVSLVLSRASETKEFSETVKEYRGKAQGHFLDHLDEELSKLEEQFDEVSEPLDDELNLELHARLDALEDSDCEEGFHHCGHGSHYCLHELLFCDGHVDCRNGADEDDDVCEGHLLTPGSSFHGLPTWEGCHTGEPSVFSFTITHKKVLPHHGSKVEVEAIVQWGHQQHGAAHGEWYVGAKELFLHVRETSLKVDCYFVTNDVADCEVNRAPEQPCAPLFRVNRS